MPSPARAPAPAARQKFLDLLKAAPATTLVVLHEAVKPGDVKKHWLLAHAAKGTLKAEACMAPNPAEMPGWIIRETRRDSTAAPAGAIGPRPARGLAWKDVPDDAGRAVDLTWELSPDDRADSDLVSGYRLRRSESPGGPWVAVASVDAGTSAVRDETSSLQRGVAYFYRVDAWGPAGVTPAGTAGAYATCNALYCHGADTTAFPTLGTGGSDTTPTWDTPATGACGTCQSVCMAGAIDYQDVETESTVRIGSVIFMDL